MLNVSTPEELCERSHLIAFLTMKQMLFDGCRVRVKLAAGLLHYFTSESGAVQSDVAYVIQKRRVLTQRTPGFRPSFSGAIA